MNPGISYIQFVWLVAQKAEVKHIRSTSQCQPIYHHSKSPSFYTKIQSGVLAVEISHTMYR